MQYEPEQKRPSVEWRYAESAKRQNVLQNSSPVKLMVIVRVQRGVRDKRLDLVDNVIIMHDNARPHKAECVAATPTLRMGRIEAPTVFSQHFTVCLCSHFQD
ncbi:hypothetical protein TNCV_2650801 [Trichonephila clavipes]|nr:hypothetical protein TNCV_2650801 [Trichonephila clavipes]